jgi:hypothetical protein
MMVIMKRRASKTEQKNRVKTESGDFSIIDRKKRKVKEQAKEKEGETEHYIRLS